MRSCWGTGRRRPGRLAVLAKNVISGTLPQEESSSVAAFYLLGCRAPGQAIQVGNLVFVSGQAAIGDDGEIVGKGDFDHQADQTFRKDTIVEISRLYSPDAMIEIEAIAVAPGTTG
jgi:enamine deaminase RidA (YjgF/YER057c/UK114 family)